MMHKVELLAPGGDIESIKAAIIAGADAIYLGLDRFNARNRAENITYKHLNGIIKFAHSNNCKVFLTLNILILDNEITALISLLNRLVNTNVDALIVQDLGLLYILKVFFPTLIVHASTQLTTHNEGQIDFLKRLNVKRVNFCRELSLSEIENLTEVCHKYSIETEVFVHGSYCIAFSGLCYFSSIQKGTSGNRGRCSQPCRDQYKKTNNGFVYPLNLKDNCAIESISKLLDFKVDSFKIEGRIKKFHYVYYVTKVWQEYLSKRVNESLFKQKFYNVFNRDFSAGFLDNNISKSMFVDNPRDHSAVNLLEEMNWDIQKDLRRAKKEIYDLRTEIINEVDQKIDNINLDKEPISIEIIGRNNALLEIIVKTLTSTFSVSSNSVLTSLKDKNYKSLTSGILYKNFKSLEESEYFIKNIDITNLENGLSLPLSELTMLKRKMFYNLVGKEYRASIELPKLKHNNEDERCKRLSVLISEEDDIYLSDKKDIDIFFKIPACIEGRKSEIISIFKNNDNITPWFSSILIGNDFQNAASLLEEISPKSIVTNNLGIAYEAFQRGIQWIAGPQLNITNSYSLICLKEIFNCSGAFISGELSKNQIKNFKKPDDFNLFYSIYNPLCMMTSRECLFYNVTGCSKKSLDNDCLKNCEKSASIIDLKGNEYLLSKVPGNYNQIYSNHNFLNIEIIKDFPKLFDNYLIDMRDINTKTNITIGKNELAILFANFISGDESALKRINEYIWPTNSELYKKGI